MADIARLLKKGRERTLNHESNFRFSNKTFIFILILATIVLVVDYVLIITFIDIIKNL